MFYAELIFFYHIIYYMLIIQCGIKDPVTKIPKLGHNSGIFPVLNLQSYICFGSGYEADDIGIWGQPYPTLTSSLKGLLSSEQHQSRPEKRAPRGMFFCSLFFLLSIEENFASYKIQF